MDLPPIGVACCVSVLEVQVMVGIGVRSPHETGIGPSPQ